MRIVRTRSWRTARGLTLIELMIALALVGILTAVALPLYNRYTLRAHRTQAFSDLGNCALSLERFYSINFTYQGAADDGGGGPANNGPPLPAVCPAQSPATGTARYNITIAAPSATTFTLTADAVGGQIPDGDLQLTSTNIKRWDKDNDGAFEDADGEDNWDE